MSNLEPIEESDLNLKNKFIGGAEKVPAGKKEPGALAKENILAPEIKTEKREGFAEKEAAYSKILSKVKTHTAPADEAVADDAKMAIEEEGAEAKIDKLVKLAMNKGVVHAVKVARHLDDNYALDEFHDRMLADEFHDALVSKGIIKEL